MRLTLTILLWILIFLEIGATIDTKTPRSDGALRASFVDKWVPSAIVTTLVLDGPKIKADSQYGLREFITAY